jgi:DNA repair exonuclease SbcCD nuclease subunit
LRILFSADWHIKLGKRNIPDEWQRNRFLLMVDAVNAIYKEHNCKQHVIGGDILDVCNPSTEDLNLYFECIARLTGDVVIYTGNHEMLKNSQSCLTSLAAETSRCNPRAVVITEPFRSKDYDIIDYTELHKKKWQPAMSKICLTHVRGAIDPHVKPEISLERFKEHGYDLVYSGDLHSVECCQMTPTIPLLYPGSPFNTSFSREIPKNKHGVFVIDTETGTHEWVELKNIPQLVRRTVDSTDKMVSDGFNRIVYELVGDVIELGKVVNSELLDKKVNTGITKDAKLPGLDGDIPNEVGAYCTAILGLSTDQTADLVSELHNIVILDDYND